MKIIRKIQSFLLTLANKNVFTSDHSIRFENTLAKKLRACTEEILHISGGSLEADSFRKKIYINTLGR